MQPHDPEHVSQRLAAMRLEHRDLDAAIARMAADPDADPFTVRRLKKRKLALKDCIARLESSQIPDQPA